MAKTEGITVRCVYCKMKWTLSFEQASQITDMPPCPNPKCAGFGVVEEVAGKVRLRP